MRRSRFEVPAGGFIVEESKSGSSQYEATFLRTPLALNRTSPLPEIPRALNLLDLFTDDDVMGVFKNAATRLARRTGERYVLHCSKGNMVMGAAEKARSRMKTSRWARTVVQTATSTRWKNCLATQESSSDEHDEPNMATRAKGVRKVPRLPQTARKRRFQDNDRVPEGSMPTGIS